MRGDECAAAPKIAATGVQPNASAVQRSGARGRERIESENESENENVKRTAAIPGLIEEFCGEAAERT